MRAFTVLLTLLSLWPAMAAAQTIKLNKVIAYKGSEA
jgi:hypothetical protein